MSWETCTVIISNTSWKQELRRCCRGSSWKVRVKWKWQQPLLTSSTKISTNHPVSVNKEKAQIPSFQSSTALPSENMPSGAGTKQGSDTMLTACQHTDQKGQRTGGDSWMATVVLTLSTAATALPLVCPHSNGIYPECLPRRWLIPKSLESNLSPILVWVWPSAWPSFMKCWNRFHLVS